MDDFFKQAAEEYLNALSNSLPQPEDCRHSFGKRFEKRMRLLIAKTLHPVRTAMLRPLPASPPFCCCSGPFWP